MPKLLKKLILSFSVFLFVFLVSSTPASAQEKTWYNPSFSEFVTKVFDSNPSEIYGERYTYAQVVWINWSLLAFANGEAVNNCVSAGAKSDVTDLQNCLEGLWQKIQKGESMESPGAFLALAGFTKSLLVAKPASGVDYLASLNSKFHLIPEAYAQQGYGFSTLEPVQLAWSASKNGAYFFMILAFIAISFMIMFRVRISPQAVANVQTMIPRLIIAVILITFSYAIAGFVLDLVTIAVAALTLAIKSVGLGGGGISHMGTIDLFNALMSGDGLIAIFLGMLIVFLLIGGVGTGVASVVAPGLGVTLGGALTILGLIFIVVLFVVLVRVFWLLLKTLITIILLTIAGPFVILLGTLPGSQGMGSWIRNLLANMAVYVVVIAMIFLAHVFFWGFFARGLPGSPSGGGPGPLPSFDTFGIALSVGGSVDVPVLPGFLSEATIIGLLISFGIVLLIPHAGNLVRSAIQGKPFDIGGAIGGGLGMLAYPGTKASGIYQEALTKAYQQKIIDRLTGSTQTQGQTKKTGGGSPPIPTNPLPFNP